jgi:hypothetical protein
VPSATADSTEGADCLSHDLSNDSDMDPVSVRREASLFWDRRGGVDSARTFRWSGGGVALGAQVHLPVAGGNVLLSHSVARP